MAGQSAIEPSAAPGVPVKAAACHAGPINPLAEDIIDP
jgi:hypothetical protein